MQTPHKIIFASHNLGIRSGETRAVIGLAKGLVGLGIDTRILACFAEAPLADELGDRLWCNEIREDRRTTLADIFTGLSRHLRIVREMVRKEVRDGHSTIVIGSDLMVPLVRHRPDFVGAPIVWYSQGGDPSLYFLKHKSNRLGTLGVLAFPPVWAMYHSWFQSLNGVIANSRFTASQLRSVSGVLADSVIYPPVDEVFFSPGTSPRKEYLLAVGRPNDVTTELNRIAAIAPMITTGGMNVFGATNLGVVSRSELQRLYAEASAVLSFVPSEHFGYSVAEALMTGTPAIVRLSGGPAEIVNEPRDGVLISQSESLEGAIRRFHSIVFDPDSIRKSAIERFSISSSAKRLLDTLRRMTLLGGPPRLS